MDNNVVDKQNNVLQDEASTATARGGHTKPTVELGGGVYRASLPNYSDGEVAVFHFTNDGKLLVDTELEITGVTINNIKVYSTDNTAANSKYGLVDSDGHVQCDILSGTLTATVSGTVAVTTLKPDGTNTMPSLDAAARKGFVQLTDGTNSAAVIATINSLKSDLSSVAGTATDVNSGNKSNGTQRVAIATDDINIVKIVNAAEIMDDWDNTDRCGVVVKYRSDYYAVEDTSFVAGDSPVTIDINGTLVRNAETGYVKNDGPGKITMNLSENGVDFGDDITLNEGDQFNIDGMNVDSIKLTWVANSAYRVFVK